MSLDSLRNIFKGQLSKSDSELVFESLVSNSKLRVESRELCFRVLSEDPKNTRCRLVLARLYYMDEYHEFCIRELVELQKHSSLDSVSRLIQSFGNYGCSFLPGGKTHSLKAEEHLDETKEEELVDKEVMAELEFDSDFIEILEDIE